MRCGCFLAFGAAALIGLGIEGIESSIKFDKPKSMTYEEFARAKPKEGWFTITGCYLDISDSIYAEKWFKDDSAESDQSDEASTTGDQSGGMAKGSPPKEGSEDGQNPIDSRNLGDGHWISHAWIPVRSARNTDAKIVPLILRTEDEGILNTIAEIRALENRHASEKEYGAWADKNLARIAIKRDLHGMLEAGWLASKKDRKKIATMNANLSSDFGILTDGARPPTTSSAASMIWFGCILAILAVAVWAHDVMVIRGWFGMNRRVQEPGAYDYTYAPKTIYAPAAAPIPPPIYPEAAQRKKESIDPTSTGPPNDPA